LYRRLSLKQLAEFQQDQKAVFKYSSHSHWLSSGPSVSDTGMERRLFLALTQPTVQLVRGKGRRILWSLCDIDRPENINIALELTSADRTLNYILLKRTFI
jgi:hypothetical protein